MYHPDREPCTHLGCAIAVFFALIGLMAIIGTIAAAIVEWINQ